MLLVSYLFLLWLHLFGFWCCFCGKVCWYLSIVSGRKFVLVPIFPVSIVAASGRNLSWFLFFQQLHHCIWQVVCIWFLFFQSLCCRIWREVCSGYYFSSIYCSIICREFCFQFLFFQLKCDMFLNSLYLDCILYVCQVLIHWVLVTLMDLVYLMVILAALSPRESEKYLVCLHLDYSQLIS